MPRPSRPKLGLTECRGSLSRKGSPTQKPGTFKKYDDGTEWWVAHCDRCDTDQIVRDHVMVRHTTEGVVYDGRTHVATTYSPERAHRVDRWVQQTLDLEPEDDTIIPF